jgi:hypothetical protein
MAGFFVSQKGNRAEQTNDQQASDGSHSDLGADEWARDMRVTILSRDA